MKIDPKSVLHLKISEIENLDPVTVILEDIEPRKGKIIIECYGKSWASFWGGMGDRTIAQFFCSCDNNYLIGNLAPTLYSSEPLEGIDLEDAAKRHLLKERRKQNFSDDDAREIYEKIDLYGIDPRTDSEGILHLVYGEEWQHCVPAGPSSEYQYLSRICDTVKKALVEATLAKAS